MGGGGEVLILTSNNSVKIQGSHVLNYFISFWEAMSLNIEIIHQQSIKTRELPM